LKQYRTPLLGRKKPIDNYSDIIIDDNVYISTGVTILGPVTNGNNVTIGAGAVVVKDIPDNCVVAGVPAKIAKYK
jgi:serine O-acetyltransferase